MSKRTPSLEHAGSTDPDSSAIDRRQLLARGSALTAFLAAPSLACQSQGAGGGPARLVSFEPIAASTAHTVRVPVGYTARVVVSWGDPVLPAGRPFRPDGEASAQRAQFGDNNDGMVFFSLGPDRGLLVVNNEFTNYRTLFPHGKTPQSIVDVEKDQAAHGVSIVTIERSNGVWRPVRTELRNRRITATTPMEVRGPAAGHRLMQTRTDPTGTSVLGTFNNCASGWTPWGTYLTCEENFDDYFGSTGSYRPDAAAERYGLSPDNAKLKRWCEFDERFDLAKEPNEPHRFGWVVEIDPRRPESTPKKRTALGRFKHENAAVVVNSDGRVVVYMGDDEQGEFVYRFVSSGRFDPRAPERSVDLLDDGTLYVARFDGAAGDGRGTGKWIPLVFGREGLSAENGFLDHGQVLIQARLAATFVGATTMDRPEWIAAHPDGRHVFCSLTNNTNRGKVAGMEPNGPNPRAENVYGQIVRWAPTEGDHTADTFDWDLFVLAGNPTVHGSGPYAGSPSIHAGNLFNGPDGLGFDRDGRLWILTDGDASNTGEFAGMGNNQMLCADPTTGEIHRFLTGPSGCEVTGLTFSPDYTTLFVGIQHPGTKDGAVFPPGGSLSRSSVLAITKDDGGVVGT